MVRSVGLGKTSISTELAIERGEQTVAEGELRHVFVDARDRREGADPRARSRRAGAATRADGTPRSAEAVLQRLELGGDLGRQVVAELAEELLDLRQLGAQRLRRRP